jgi:hypothetical protein
VAVSFIDGGNRTTYRKITDLPQVTDIFYQIMLLDRHQYKYILTRNIAEKLLIRRYTTTIKINLVEEDI